MAATEVERLIHHTSRPTLAHARFQLRNDGPVYVRFKRPGNDRTRAILLKPTGFIARLSVLVPLPHTPCYFGD